MTRLEVDVEKILLVLLVLLTPSLSLAQDSSIAERYYSYDSMLARAVERATTLLEERNRTYWEFSISPYEMGGEILIARNESQNSMRFRFPYEGDQRGTLMLRNHPRQGNEVLFYINRGQLPCHGGHSYGTCNIQVRFGAGEARRWTAASASLGNSTTLFLRNFDEFIRLLQGVDRLLIEVNVYGNGLRVFEFNVRNIPQQMVPAQRAATRREPHSTGNPQYCFNYRYTNETESRRWCSLYMEDRGTCERHLEMVSNYRNVEIISQCALNR